MGVGAISMVDVEEGGGGGGVVFFFSSRRRHTRSLCDWSSDVCSSDLAILFFSALPTQSPPMKLSFSNFITNQKN